MKTLQDGEWVTPIRKGFKLGCCDCGLVHTVNFRVTKGVLQFQTIRDRRATTRRRKSLGLKA